MKSPISVWYKKDLRYYFLSGSINNMMRKSTEHSEFNYIITCILIFKTYVSSKWSDLHLADSNDNNMSTANDK